MEKESQSDTAQSIDRIFYDILKRVGSRGKYQFFCQILWCFLSTLCGALSYFIPFLYYQGSYQCPPEFKGSCKDFVCDLPDSQRSQFIHFDQITMLSNYGSYLCDDQNELNNIMSLAFAGAFIGSIITALLLKFMRKKDIFILSMVINTIGIILIIVNQSLLLNTFGCFLIEGFACSIFQIILCFVSQTVDQQKMVDYEVKVYISFGIGIAINGPLFYFFSWKIVLIVFILLPFLVCLIFLYYYVEETVFDMFASLTSVKIYQSLILIAKRNEVNDHGLTEEEVGNIQRQYEENQMKKNKGIQLSIFDVFKFSSIRKLVILGFFLQFVLYYLFGASVIVISKYSMSIYLNIFLLGISEIIGSLIYMSFLENYPRKTIIYFFAFLEAIVLGTILYFASCVEQCSQQASIFQTVGLFIFRMLMAVCYSGYYILIFDTFPIQIRSQALMVVNIAVGFAELIIPLMMNLTNSLNVSIIWTFFIGNLLVVFFIYFLPETLNNPAPDIILELSYDKTDKIQGKQSKIL